MTLHSYRQCQYVSFLAQDGERVCPKKDKEGTLYSDSSYIHTKQDTKGIRMLSLSPTFKPSGVRGWGHLTPH